VFWTIVDRVVNLTFLLLAIIIITLLLNSTTSSKDANNFNLKIEAFRQETVKALGNNVDYADRRINRLSETQDSYQNSTDQRVYLLEQQIKMLQLDKRNNQKIINNNSSNAIVYEK